MTYSNMGPTTKPYRLSSAKTLELLEHNGHMVVAKPSGVPAKWVPIYHELASRMYEGGPSFSIGKDKGSSVVKCMIDEGDGAWMEYLDPKWVRRALKMDDEAPKAKTASRVAAVPAPEPVSLPTWAADWVSGLTVQVDYVRAFLEHLLCDGPEPADPETSWAKAARAEAQRLADAA